MQKLVCELCRSNNFTKDDDGYFVCDYCRTKYTASQAQSMMVEGTVRVDRSGDVANLVRMASSGWTAGNFPECYDYANRALEIDPENATAWFLKGVSCGFMPVDGDRRMPEMRYAIERAIEYSGEGTLTDIRKSCTDRLSLLTESAIAAKDFQAACDYLDLTSVLEPTNAGIFFVKGSCMGAMSSLEASRLGDMVVAFDEAIDRSDDAGRSAMSARCSNHAIAVVVHENGLSLRDIETTATPAANFRAHFAHSQQSLMVLGKCFEWTNSRMALEHYVAIASRLVRGTPCWFSNGAKRQKGTVALPQDEKAGVQAQAVWARARLAELASPPTTEPAKSSLWSSLRSRI